MGGKFCTYTELALNKKFMVVYPQGKDDAWNAGPGCCSSGNVDDTCFIKHVVEQIKTSYQGISHIFATGHSNGGCMDWRLACELPVGYLTAIAPIHGVMGGSTHDACDASPDKKGMNSTVLAPGFTCDDDRALPTLAWTGDQDNIQTWIEVYASADRFREMFRKRLQNYAQTSKVSFMHKNSDNARYLECTSTATPQGEGNVTVCMNRDPSSSGCSFFSCAYHRYPDDTCEEDSHGTSVVLDFFLSQIKVKQTKASSTGALVV